MEDYIFTPLGRFLRNYRFRNGIILKEMADALQTSPAELCKVEFGRKKPPKDWKILIPQIYKFNKQELDEFKKVFSS